MDQQPYLRKTVTQRLRGFLEQTGGTPPVWATADEVIDRLWLTLRARRSDPAFWREFAALVEDLRADAAREAGVGLADPSAELLGRARVEDLVAELQAALDASPETPGRGGSRRARPHLSAALAACLFLLGTAACKKSPSDTAGTEAESPVPAPTLASYVEESGLDPEEKVDLQECLAQLPTQRTDDLVALFRDSPPEVIASTLEAFLLPGADCGPAVEPPAADAGAAPAPDAGSVEPAQPEAGTTGAPDVAPTEPAPPEAGPPEATRRPPPDPSPAPAYKGVSFD